MSQSKIENSYLCDYHVFLLVPGYAYQRNYPLGATAKLGGPNSGGPGSQTSSIFVTPEQQQPIEPAQEYQPHDDRVYKSSLTVTPPSSFRPVPIEEKEPAPQPQPATHTQPKPFKDAGVFEDVDTHAVEVTNNFFHRFYE